MASFGATRRLALLAGLAGVLRPAQAAGPGDNGIGGTGKAQARPDTGIGGTGYIGTIRNFGSILVNGDRITYSADTAIEIDGRGAGPGDMQIGQIVRCMAQREGDALATRRIRIVSEIIGTVSAVDRDRLVVLGQAVDVRGISFASVMMQGSRVAVHGLRRPDGVIVASLVTDTTNPDSQLAGILRRAGKGFAIGDQAVAGAPSRLVGSRVLVRGRLSDGVLHAASAVADPLDRLAGASRMSVEAYVRAASGNRLAGDLGSDSQAGFMRVVNLINAPGRASAGPQGFIPAGRIYGIPGNFGPRGVGGQGGPGRPGGAPGGPSGRPGGPATPGGASPPGALPPGSFGPGGRR